MKWTLDYVDSLDLVERGETLAVLDAVDKARAHLERRAQAKARRGKR